MAEYTNLTIGGVAIDEKIKQRVEELKPTKLSELTNDAKYATASDKIASTKQADSATSLSSNSGVTAGSKGPTASLTLAANNKTGTIKIPQFTVTAQGVITSMVERTLKITTGCLQCSVTEGCDQCAHCDQTSGCSQCYDCSDCDRCNHCDRFP